MILMVIFTYAIMWATFTDADIIGGGINGKPLPDRSDRGEV